MTRRSVVPWAIVLIAALAYPISVLAGGTPRFPSRSECVHVAHADGDLEVVFGYFDSQVRAQALLDRVLSVGFKGSVIERNACGRVKVAVHGIPTVKVGDEVMAEARGVGLRPTLEQVRR
jgi:hypothetical protein